MNPSFINNLWWPYLLEKFHSTIRPISNSSFLEAVNWGQGGGELMWAVDPLPLPRGPQHLTPAGWSGHDPEEITMIS